MSKPPQLAGRVHRYNTRVDRLAFVYSAISLALFGACGGPEEPSAPDAAMLARQAEELAAVLRETESASGLRVQLAFYPDVDLDLYVTDPLEESVYFANTPSRSGGELIEDRRCGDGGIRLEEVYFPNPPPGRYRVGIDYPKHCRHVEATAAFAVALTAAGLRQERAGTIAFHHFLPTILEIDFSPDASETTDTR